jgi:hypothetical protein
MAGPCTIALHCCLYAAVGAVCSGNIGKAGYEWCDTVIATCVGVCTARQAAFHCINVPHSTAVPQDFSCGGRAEAAAVHIVWSFHTRSRCHAAHIKHALLVLGT